MEGGVGVMVDGVRGVVTERAVGVGAFLDGDWDARLLVGGKLLRTRFAARVTGGVVEGLEGGDAARLCAAVEMVHTASLCHDDVIDNAPVRRSRPALWRRTSASGAVLIGDLLMCEAIDLLLEVEGGRYLAPFVSKLREVCATEAEQELRLRGQRLDEATCLRIARGKTGPLFAFLGGVCGGGHASLARALEEAGYRVGAAYQLADDLLDCVGDADIAGKTLGTDCSRRKFTLASQGGRRLRERMSELCRSAVTDLSPWPAAMEGLERFLEEDVRPLWAKQFGDVDLGLRCAR